MSVDLARNALPTFDELQLPPALVKTLARAGITTPTPVQAAVIPDALAGRDILGRAATGSGKTLAFGLPILLRLTGGRSKPKSPRSLIVVPTRELAGQVRSSLEPFADVMGLKIATVYGGTSYDRQIKRLRQGVDIVVATPGRLQDLIRKGACNLDRVEVTVLDEADHLCDLGFFPAVSEIVAMTPSGGQRMLLSATLDGDVDRLVRKHLHDAVTHDCDPDSDKPDMHHHVLVTGMDNKVQSAADLLRSNPRSIVFTRTRRGATNLAKGLAGLGVTTVDLHGSLSQNARERNLRKFKSGDADVVVATDVAARGIHVDGVSLVVHYDAPTEHKAYLHRSGRTARAGQSGTVVTMTTSRQVGSVVKLQKAAGVTALHHDVRTATQPMTPESLAAHGVPASASAIADSHEGGREQSRSRSGGRPRTGASTRSSSATRSRGPRRDGGRPTGTRSEGRSWSSESSPRSEAGERRGAPRRGSSTSSYQGAQNGSSIGSGAAALSAGSAKKARWSAADKRARTRA